MFHFVFSPSVILVKVSSDMVDYKFNIRYKAWRSNKASLYYPKSLIIRQIDLNFKELLLAIQDLQFTFYYSKVESVFGTILPVSVKLSSHKRTLLGKFRTK